MKVSKPTYGAVSVLILAERTDTAAFNPVQFHITPKVNHYAIKIKNHLSKKITHCYRIRCWRGIYLCHKPCLCGSLDSVIVTRPSKVPDPSALLQEIDSRLAKKLYLTQVSVQAQLNRQNDKEWRSEE